MRHRSVVIVAFEDVQGLDVFGPADVFYFANYLAEVAGADQAPYTVHVAGPAPGPIRTAAGPMIHADVAVSDPRLRPDVLLIAGGIAVGAAANDEQFVADIADLADRSEEVGSICSGALLLAETGLLDGRRATTHWASAAKLAEAHPDVEAAPDSIYVHDGVWSSAGVTAGIDLALQLLRTHHGAEMAADAARNMVVYVKRSGGQQQFSAQLAAQSSTHPTIEDVCAYIVDNPSADLSVVALAERVAMSERSFQRLFSKEVGTSPAKFVERCRIDAGRRLLESTTDGLSTIARRCGFTSPETFLRAFKRLVGVNPTEYRQRFSA